MAGHGPDPKDPAVRARRNRVSTAGVIDATPATMPPLGRFRPDGPPRQRAASSDSSDDPPSSMPSPVPWHPETRRWWKTIWASAIADRWVDAHVPGLRSLARLVDDFWRSTDPATAKQIHAEIRQAGREYGLSPMAARSLNWEFRRPTPPEEKAAPLPPGADPRKVLTMDSRRRGSG